jgi:hypothetical protein
MDSIFANMADEEFLSLSLARRGRYAGESVKNHVWLARIAGDPQGWRGEWTPEPAPAWSFDRFGMTRTLLPDGTQICIGGEHEDSYDPHFFIYNDVIVRSFDGETRIYCFTTDAFQPTDFHSATLVSETEIILIGGLGYSQDRILGTCPMYRLDLEEMQFSRLEVRGYEPGWIYSHEALYLAGQNSIAVWGGKHIDLDQSVATNQALHVFDLQDQTWEKVDSIQPQA